MNDKNKEKTRTSSEAQKNIFQTQKKCRTSKLIKLSEKMPRRPARQSATAAAKADYDGLSSEQSDQPIDDRFDY